MDSDEENYHGDSINMATHFKKTEISIGTLNGRLETGDVNNVYIQNQPKCKLIMMMALLIGILLCIFLICSVPPNNRDVPTSKPIFYSSTYSAIDYPGVTVRNRSDWGANPFGGKSISYTKKPTEHIIITQTGTEAATVNVKKLVKDLQKHHLHTRKWNDIGYNFLIDMNGIIYEGLGWSQTCIDVDDFNGICFAFIGTFNESPPNDHAIDALEKMIDHGYDHSFLVKNYTISGHPRLLSRQNNKLIDKIKNHFGFKFV